jgi:DNA-binding transcriptional regulator YiaG
MNMTVAPYPKAFPETKNAYESCSPIRLVIPLLVLTAGTGGVMTAHNTAEALSRYHYPRIQVEPFVAKKIDARSPAELVANIREIFAINMSDLAAILGVTRPTVYAWLEGQEPKPEAVIHIQRLSRAADEVKQANIPRIEKLMHRPILDGLSLVDLLKADEDPLEAIAMLKAIAEKEAQTRREPKGSGKRLRSLNDVLGESSVAIHERS